MFLPSLARMAEDFQVDYALINLSVAGYLAVSAGLQLIMGPLSDRFGRRPILLICMAIFVSSLGCVLAESIWVFLGFRLLQAARSWPGRCCPAQRSGTCTRRTKRPANWAICRMAMALAPMLGPMLGGALDMLFGWRAGFVLHVWAGPDVLVLLWAGYGRDEHNARLYLCGPDARIPASFPRAPVLGLCALCAAFSIGGFFSFITGAPLVAAAWFDLSPAMLGLGIGIITGGFMVGNFITGRIAKRTQN